MTAEPRPSRLVSAWSPPRRRRPGVRPCAVIPVFDNATTVAAVALAAADHLDLVIVVDDGSRDGSGDAARAAGARLRPGRAIEVVTLPRNRGKGAALVAGLRRAEALGRTHAVTIDADGQHRASDVPAMLAAARSNPRSIVVGARDMEAACVPHAARVGRRVSNFWTLRSTGFCLPDTTCGMRVYPVSEVLALAIRTRHYDYEGEVLVRGAWAGLELRSHPIDVWYPQDRRARVSHYQPWKDSLRITAMYVRLAMRRLLPMAGTAPPGPPRLRRVTAAPAVPVRQTLSRLRAIAASGTHANEIALAIGVGVFLGATPLWGLHTIVSLYVAARWRLNLVATLLATNVSFPFFTPFLVFGSVQTGHMLRHGEWLDLARDEVTLAGVGSHAADYVLGGFALAAALGIVAGVGALLIGGAVERRGRRRAGAPRPVDGARPAPAVAAAGGAIR